MNRTNGVSFQSAAMNTRSLLALAVVTALLAGTEPALCDEQTASASSPSPQAVQLLLTSVVGHSNATPAGEGYLWLASRDVETARRHVHAALEVTQDPVQLKRHLAMALHALDPAFGLADGGESFGVRPALTQAAEALAGVTKSGLADRHAEELAAAVASVRTRVDEAFDFGRAAQVSPSTEVAKQAAKGMQMALDRAVEGWDRKGDGHIDWRLGEAGLSQAQLAAQGLSATDIR